MDSTRAFYRLAYAIGFHPWEDAATHPPFVETLSELIEREEDGREPPYGPALDLGCGSGVWGVWLARRGWRVEGVDMVERALRRARRRVRAAGVDVRLVRGDVTQLETAALGRDFRLVLDSGTFHGLTRDQRRAMGRGVDAITARDATVFLLVWRPQKRGPLPRGVSRADIEEAFPRWRIDEIRPSHFEAPAPVERLMKPDERWVRLRRIGAA